MSGSGAVCTIRRREILELNRRERRQTRLEQIRARAGGIAVDEISGADIMRAARTVVRLCGSLGDLEASLYGSSPIPNHDDTHRRAIRYAYPRESRYTHRQRGRRGCCCKSAISNTATLTQIWLAIFGILQHQLFMPLMMLIALAVVLFFSFKLSHYQLQY